MKPPLSKKKFLALLHQQLRFILFEGKGLKPKDIGDNCSKERQSMERFLQDDNYNPTVYYLYEVCDGNKVDLLDLLNYILSKAKNERT